MSLPDNALDTLSDDELAALSDQQLGEITGSAILGAAVMNNSRWSETYHRRVDRAYAECARRKRGIYQRAFNSAARSQGHHGMVRQPEEGQA
jgi:hypothetical protein